MSRCPLFPLTYQAVPPLSGILGRSCKRLRHCRAPRLQGDDVTFLPPIVESAESSPAAAAECARLIRKFVHRDYWSKPWCQYNAIMLIRILADNPGPTFTRNFDKKFVDTAKDLLKHGRDGSVRQLLMETLDSLHHTKGNDPGVALLLEMWQREKEKAYRAYGVSPPFCRRAPDRAGKTDKTQQKGTSTETLPPSANAQCTVPVLAPATTILAPAPTPVPALARRWRRRI